MITVTLMFITFIAAAIFCLAAFVLGCTIGIILKILAAVIGAWLLFGVVCALALVIVYMLD